MDAKQDAILRRAKHKETPVHEAVTAAKIALERASTPLARAQARAVLYRAERRLARSQKGSGLMLGSGS